MKLTIKQLKQIIKEQVEEAKFQWDEVPESHDKMYQGEGVQDRKSDESLEDMLNELEQLSELDETEYDRAILKTKILDYVQKQIDSVK